MARHKKVSDQDALLAAINLFWQNGYHNVGTREIEAQTGITRFTLQTSYGGKKALFLKALDTYLDLTDRHLLAPLATADLKTLARWFDSPTIPQEFEGSVQSGCFMVNTITALGGQDADGWLLTPTSAPRWRWRPLYRYRWRWRRAAPTRIICGPQPRK